MTNRGRGLSRRMVLRGIGGAVLGLPFLEGLLPREAHAQSAPPPFVVFFRQAAGVACEQDAELGFETEKFWPVALGDLSPENLGGRALDELLDHRAHLLVVRGVAMHDFDYGDGHAGGALQGLTARGPTVDGAGGDSEASGESIDHRIGRELNPDGHDSLFLYAGANGGWLGGPCISYRDSAVRRAALRDPWGAYQQIVGGAGLAPDEAARVALRQKSVNDLVRGQLQSLQRTPALSASDHRRLQLHLDSVRDLEVALSCRLALDQEQILETGSSAYDESSDGQAILATAELHMDVAALAVACGFTRSVAIQVGNGNDGDTRYPDPDTGQLMTDNYHYISHRRQSHDSSGTIIPNSDSLHHKIDRHFAKAFKHLLDKLSAYDLPSGGTLLDQGLAVWHNDNGNGPGHARTGVPFILAGSAGGFLKQGISVDVGGGWDKPTHNQLLNTIGSAAGLRNAAGEYLDDFGDPSLPKGVLSALLA